MKKVRGYYSKEFKIKAVELVNQKGNLSEVALELGVKRDSLKRWKTELTLGKFAEGTKPSIVKSPEEQELAALRKELYETKLERDILKKAVSIFSKSDR